MKKIAAILGLLLINTTAFAFQWTTGDKVEAASIELQNKVKNDVEAIKALKQAVLEDNENASLICSTGQFLALGWINDLAPRNFLQSISSNLIEAYNLSSDVTRKFSTTQSLGVFRKLTDRLKFYMPKLDRVEIPAYKDDVKACAVTTLLLLKQMEKMNLETQAMLSSK